MAEESTPTAGGDDTSLAPLRVGAYDSPSETIASKQQRGGDMKSEQGLIGATVRLLIAAGLLGSAGLVHAGDYCCTCKGQTVGKTINASSRALAVGQCSLECGNFTNVSSNKCAEPPPAATPTPAPAPTPSASGSVVLAYQSADCSGDPIRVTAPAKHMAQSGVLSFQVESGASATVWEKADYAGRGTAPVAPTLCVSPGFEIQSIQLQ
jgi:hypothetical protein